MLTPQNTLTRGRQKQGQLILKHIKQF